jgi:H+-translocating NAD(P) transhydrogenase subunit alpha
MKVGVPKEALPGERRVALVPEALARLKAAGIDVLVERGAGTAAAFPDGAYEEAGATIVSVDQLYAQADCVVKVQKPTEAEAARLRAGQALIGLLSPLIDPGLMQQLAERGVTAISLDAIPRTLSRAQSMDVLSSQANIAGYKAVLVAAEAFGRYFPLLTTAAGTAKPAAVLILGIGVAGLQAIGTARRLGAVVKAYDVRPETREQAESLGAVFVVLKTAIDATGSGGYARELTPEERAAQQAELNAVIGGMDVVITTAQVPGRKPPVLVTADAVRAMKPGSVIVDMAASALGGNCELSRAGQTIATDNGVTIIAPENLPATVAVSASQFYARNLQALLLHLVKDGQLALDPAEEITAGVLITHAGKVVQPATAKLLAPPAAAGLTPAPPAAPPAAPAAGGPAR